jgi:hypothetical protein
MSLNSSFEASVSDKRGWENNDPLSGSEIH